MYVKISPEKKVHQENYEKLNNEKFIVDLLTLIT